MKYVVTCLERNSSVILQFILYY